MAKAPEYFELLLLAERSGQFFTVGLGHDDIPVTDDSLDQAVLGWLEKNHEAYGVERRPKRLTIALPLKNLNEEGND